MKTAPINLDIARAISRSEEFPLISIQQVSKQHGVSVRSLRRWEAAGQMPPRTKHGHRMKYRKDEIALMMAQRLRSECLP
jgi:predicted site-specific integrase-resolvase